MQLKMFIILSKQLYNVDQTLNSQENFSSYSMKVLSSKLPTSLETQAAAFPQIIQFLENHFYFCTNVLPFDKS